MKKKKKKIDKNSKELKSKKKVKQKQQIIVVPTNKNEKLVDLKLMRSHNFLSSTNSTHTEIYEMTQVKGQQYKVAKKPKAYSTILKLVLTIPETNPLSESWSLILWNITQGKTLDPSVKVTIVRAFEKKDNELVERTIKNRRRALRLSSDNEKSMKKASVATLHDRHLLNAIESGDSVINFGAEMIVTAPSEEMLEKAVTDVSNYLKLNDETRGLKWGLDVNKQNYPFILHGPNAISANKGQYYELTSEDAAHAALFVDSGGDRLPGAEYVGVSVGKLIESHAAYNFINHRSVFVGNDSEGKTYTRSRIVEEPSQIYLSKIVSRAYLLNGKSVTHFVLDNYKNCEALNTFALNDDRKITLDVSKGYLNILEAIKPTDFENLSDYGNERITSFYDTHLNNIVALFSQFRDKDTVSTTDSFSTVTRRVLSNFFIDKGYWRTDAINVLDDLRLFGLHDGFKTLSDFGQYVTLEVSKNVNPRDAEALDELQNIVRDRILITLPSLNVKTNPIVDKLIRVPYRVIDLTSMSIGSMTSLDNPSLNIMCLAYLNIILPSLRNNDVIVFHGMSRISKIAKFIQTMIKASGKDIDVVFTEGSETQTLMLEEVLIDEVDFTMVDLYQNRVDKLVPIYDMDVNWCKTMRYSNGSYFVKTQSSNDYIYMDDIL